MKYQVKPTTWVENRRDFYATCSDAEVKETETYFYKQVDMFGRKELRFWKGSGRISTVTNEDNFTKQ